MRRRRLLLIVPWLAACAATPAPTAVAPLPTIRTEPDESDLAGLIPAGTQTLLEVDLAALRVSPWSRPILEAAPAEERAAKASARGFDEIADVDRAVFGTVAVPGGSVTLVVSQGRFDRGRVVRAFQDSVRAASGGTEPVEASWRGIPLWHAKDRAIAFLTARTLITGPVEVVRAAIDCGFGVTPDVRSDASLGSVRTALHGPAGAGAIRLSAILTDEMRGRVRSELWPAGEGDVPTGLRRFGGRLDLGKALDVEVVGFLDNPRAARALMEMLESVLRDLRTRRELVAFGLAPFLGEARVAAQGPRVLGKLVLPEERRDELVTRLSEIAQAVAAAGAQGRGAASP